jgi:hypothetical protein
VFRFVIVPADYAYYWHAEFPSSRPLLLVTFRVTFFFFSSVCASYFNRVILLFDEYPRGFFFLFFCFSFFFFGLRVNCWLLAVRVSILRRPH